MAVPSAAANAFASQLNASMQRAIRDQRNYVEALGEQRIRDGHVQGFLNLATAGEIVATVTFPISFLERPLFTSGLELADNTWLVDGNFPIWSATVGSWTTRKAADTTLYIGATIGIVVIGAPRSVLHYSFAARSLTVSTGTNTSVGSTL